ncbi:DUF1501 domain-containing protein [bacterium]|nr:DUF1501 domain-containing protein [bacterium]
MNDRVNRLLSRREFLRKGITIAAAATSVPTFLNRTALAIEGPKDSALVSSRPGVPDDKVLVVVQLGGGNDGLNSVIPFTQDGYFKQRPSLAVPADKVIRLNDDLSLHPALAGFKHLYDNGQLAIVQGVGYPNPDRSHFRSMEIWQSGKVESFETRGWIGRVFDHSCNNSHLRGCSPTSSISIGNTLNPALRGASGTGVAVRNPEHLYRMTRLYMSSRAQKDGQEEQTGAPSTLDFLRRTALNAELSADRIRRSVRQVQNRSDYPRNPFAQGLKLIAGMIAGGMDTRVYYISLTGFDTHANQQGVHERLLTALSDGLVAFQKDLSELDHAGRVLGMVFSEFGRRVAENASRGTDHGQQPRCLFLGIRYGLVFMAIIQA